MTTTSTTTPAVQTAAGASTRTPTTRRRTSTPRSVRRLRRLQLGAVALLLAFGALVAAALTVSLDASSRAAESLTQYQRLADARIQALEVQQAANSWALTPTDDVRTTVTSQLTTLATTLADASAVEADRDRIVPLTGALVHYSMTLQDALNANGTAAAALLAKADTQLTDELLTPLATAGVTAGDRVQSDLTSGWLPWVIGGFAVTAGGLIAISVALARASHRYLNPGVALALICALASVAVLALTATTASNTATGFAQGSRADLEAASSVQQQLNQARADELLAVGLQSAGTSYLQRWSTAYTAANAAIANLPTTSSPDLTAYNAAHAQVATAVGKAQWDVAAGLVTGAAQTAFTAVDQSLNTITANLRSPVTSSVKSVGDGVIAGIAGVIVLTLAGAGLAVWGVARRIEEYR
ncbi:MAG: hypothetical protein QM619_00710 [Micropruina sp.]|uniref:hypothetical protein n=1 Tax=Micropruina sp. TaxID=2737536 RepID=UPI0039E2303A